MIKDADRSGSGFRQLFEAPFWTFRLIFAVSILTVSLASHSWAQTEKPQDGIRNSSASQALNRLKPVRPQTLTHASQAAKRSQPETRSIVEPASHQELIIPNAIQMQESHSEATHDLGLTDLSCNGHDNAYDFVADRRTQLAGRYYLFDWSRADLWVGTSGFTNPASSFVNGTSTAGQVEGSFGFQEGFNFGSQLPSLLSGQIGAQLGMRFVQSNLDGSGASDSSRNQMFATAGLFRRIDYGFQGGMVVDYLRDQWVYKGDLWQIRGELSFLFSPAHELGFRFTDGGRTHRQSVRLASGTTVNVALEPMDTYRLFGRMRFGHCAASSAEIQLGTSRDGGVLLGCTLQNPLSGQIGLETAATYFLPQPSAVNPDTREAWNLSLALVWTPGRLFGTQRDYNRPLFEVAGNGSFIASRP